MPYYPPADSIFKNIAVAGQNTVVADSSIDTLTLVEGTNITITTDDTTDEITISAAGAGGGTVNTGAQYKAAYYPTATNVVDDWAGVEFGQTNLNTEIISQSTTELPLLITLAASQAEDAFQIKTNSGTQLFTVSETGVLSVLGPSNSLMASFTEQSTGGSVAIYGTSGGSRILFGGSGSIYGTSGISIIANTGHIATITANGFKLGNSTVGSPTSILELEAGSTTRAPLKLTTGTALTTPEDGAMEYHASHLYFTIGSTRYQLDQQSGGSGITRTVVSTSGSITLGSAASTDYMYFVTGAHTMSMPAAAGNTNRYTVKNNHSANITIDTAGAETIEGAASISIAPESSVDIISNGTNWYII